MRKVEILAPAGSLESLKAAINASCDAVYIGGSKFGARAYADNPEEDSLIQAIDFAHIHNKKIYLTVNTLLKNSELENELYDYLEKYYLEGLDAVIVQDVGVLHFIHEHFPNLDIHASTQMTLTMASGIEALKHMGVTRLVNSRELGLEEIKQIRKNTDLEIESFVHGALCYCYSGQCLISSMIGGRSGNRGRCAQTCRMPFQVLGDKKNLFPEQDKYVLSPKDICTLDMIPDLIEAGITSFKIEGRMKRPEYAAGVTEAYSKYVDLYSELGREKYESYVLNHKTEFNQDIMNLQDLYNRGGFSKGYYINKNGNSMMSPQRPNHSGVYVGTVKSVKGSQVQIALEENIYPQDILEIREHKENETNKNKVIKTDNEFSNKNMPVKTEHNAPYKSKIVKTEYTNKTSFGSVYEFTVKDGENKGGTYTVNVNKGLIVLPASPVYRTKNNKLLESLGEQYLKEDVKIPIRGKLSVIVGKPIYLKLSCRHVEIEISGDLVEEAKNQPMTEDKIRKQIYKTNDTSFSFDSLELHMEGASFIPLQKLNELRRNAIDELSSALIGSYRRDSLNVRNTKNNAKYCDTIDRVYENETLLKETNESYIINDKEGSNKKVLRQTNTLGIHLAIEKKDQLVPACERSEVTDIYLDSDVVPLSQLLELTNYIQNKGKRCFIILPHIFRNDTYQFFKKYKSLLTDNTINGYILRNFEEYAFVKNECEYVIQKKEVITDYNLYIMNREAAKFWSELEIKQYTAPVELNYAELRELKGLYYDMIVYGRIPLMVSAQCIAKTASGGTNKYINRVNDNPCCEAGIKNIELIDRYQKSFQVKRHCRDCYNTIYNSQCLSLLNNKEEILKVAPANIRLNFTFESPEETEKIISAFINHYIYDLPQDEIVKDYTRGHFKRGIE